MRVAPSMCGTQAPRPLASLESTLRTGQASDPEARVRTRAGSYPYPAFMRSPLQPDAVSVAVITVSDRSARGERKDTSGPKAIRALEESGFRAIGDGLVTDGADSVRDGIERSVERGFDVILTLGGTGVGPRDQTPEGTRSLIDHELPGICEGIRAEGAKTVPTAALSRGLAGISRPSAAGHRAVIVNLPGSTGAVRDGVRYLTPLLPHLVDQLRGGDH